VSVVVKRLVRARLVSRVTSEHDARRVELAVTAKGRALLAKAPLAAQERLIGGIEQLSRKDTQELARSLQRLVAAMQLGQEPPSMFFETEARTRPRPSGARRG
jgi:DNA-binding MarR family transcriptional regulator